MRGQRKQSARESACQRGDASGTISLPVFVPDHPPSFTARRQRRVQRWRLIALVIVHALIAMHLLHWWINGRTVGRFVLSDSMETLELGRLNPGFLLFSTALLITLIAGRWLCGWGCHMGALQDACGWILRRCGVKPKPLRTRLLGYTPLMLGVYMFIWPTFRRDALVPLLERYWPRGLGMVGRWQPFPGWENALVSSDLWNGMPGLAVAVPFLLVCGGATVYFLGSRGFCRYACPYGGMFASVERLAPLRVRVDINACDGCGKCTAACSSGIRVHEEVRAYGCVISDRCIKTLDCVAVCPHDALSFGLTKPSLLKGSPRETRPKRLYDTTWGEELIVSGIFVVTFLSMRGLYGAIPMLMAVGIAISAAGGGWWVWRCVTRLDVRACGMQFKRAGRLSRIGMTHVAGLMLVGLLIFHSAGIRLMQWYAGTHDQHVTRTRDEVFHASAPELDSEIRAHAEAALRWYAWSASLGTGGLGLANTPQVEIRRAWLELVIGDLEHAQDRLELIASGPYGTDSHHADLARVALMRQDPDSAVRQLNETIAKHPEYTLCRELLAWMLVQSGSREQAKTLYESRLRETPGDAECRLGYGALLLRLGLLEQARMHLIEVIRQNPKMVRAHHELAACYVNMGRFSEANAVLERAKQIVPAAAESFAAHQLRLPEP